MFLRDSPKFCLRIKYSKNPKINAIANNNKSLLVYSDSDSLSAGTETAKNSQVSLTKKHKETTNVPSRKPNRLKVATKVDVTTSKSLQVNNEISYDADFTTEFKSKFIAKTRKLCYYCRR